MRVVTTEIAEPTSELLANLPDNPTTFIRHGDGLAGWGEAARLTAKGPRRFQQLAEAWQNLIANADVTDHVELPGSGLVAFGSIAFADSSSTESVLIIPKVTFGSRDGRHWITRIDGAEISEATDAETSATTGTETSASGDQGLQLEAGTQTLAGFEQSVVDALEAIEAGRVEKVVLARDLQARIPEGFDLRVPLRKLASRYPSCWVYSVDGCFGASPELLVRVSHKQVSARVLAGTAGRGTDPAVDQAIGEALSASHKNLAEHTFAVDSMVRALEPFCDHVDADQTPFAMPLPNVWHLASDVHGVLSGNSSVLDLAAAIHPTAAVAGTPREASLALIEELEPFDRGRYAGPVGWIGADGDGEWAIALRGAQITGDVVHAFAGCGIVSESDPASEAAETQLKFKPIVDALAKA